MTKTVCLADNIPFGFPFVAVKHGIPSDYRRLDTLVTVLGYAGMEKLYLRVRHPSGRLEVVNDSLLFVDVVE